MTAVPLSARVAIIIPAFNAAPFIDECLASVQAQTFSDWTCIVVDDGSTDNTVLRVEAFNDPRIRLIRQANKGVSAARNNGLAVVDSDYLMFLDADDSLHPAALARLVAGFTRPETVVTFGTLLKRLENGDPYPQQKPLALHRYPTGDVLAPMLRQNFVANGGHVLIRTEIARKLGGFDESLRLSEDWEFWCRLALEGPFHFIGNTPEVFYLRVREGSSSPRLAQQLDNHLASIQCVMGNKRIEARFTPSQWSRLKRQMMGSHYWEAGRVNFTRRHFAPARRLMLQSLKADLQAKRVALFGIAQLSQLLNVSLVSRLRFTDHDSRASRKLTDR